MKTILHWRELAALVVASGILTAAAFAQEPWRKVKDVEGRELEIQVQKVEDGKVTFVTRAGKGPYTLFLTKFSDEDRKMLRNWKPAAVVKSPVQEDSQVEVASQTGSAIVYRSKHFEFEFSLTERDPDGAVVGEVPAAIPAEIAPGFERTFWGFTGLPVSLEPLPRENHFKVRVVRNPTDFPLISGEHLSEGQPGIYNLAKDNFYGILDRLEPSPELAYEVTFALLGERLSQLPPWLSVAFAEYLAAAPVVDHQLSFADPLENIVNSLQSRHGMAKDEVVMNAPSRIMQASFSDFRSADPANSSRARASALLLLHYFAAIDGAGDGVGLGDYFRAIRTNTAADEAEQVLLKDRDAAKLADDIRVGYLTKGLEVTVQ